MKNYGELRTEACWNCGEMTSFWVDEDGTPRDVKSIEHARLAARIIEQIAAMQTNIKVRACCIECGGPIDEDGGSLPLARIEAIFEIIRKELK